jgi:hypothetical protein
MAFLPFEKLNLFADPQFVRPIDLGKSEAASFGDSNRTVYVRTSRTQVQFSGGKQPFSVEVALADRGFELRRKSAQSLPHIIRKIQLFVGPYFVDDNCHISTLGITAQEQIRVTVLQIGNVRLSFKDLQGAARECSFPADGKKTLGDLAALFSRDAPMAVAYEAGP